MKKPNTKLQSYKFGVLAEFITIIFLKLKGYKILKRRYKTLVGEVDIIAKKGKLLIAVEVKARKDARKDKLLLEEILSPHQQKRIKRAMLFFTTVNFRKYFNYPVRFDLMVIKPWRFPKHYKNFWE